MNNKGFIATSILYSFLAVFILLIMTIVTNYAHNRALLNKSAKSIKDSFNETNEKYDKSGAKMPDYIAYNKEQENFDDATKVYMYPVYKSGLNWVKVEDDWKNHYNYNSKYGDVNFAAVSFSNEENQINKNYIYYWIPIYEYFEDNDNINFFIKPNNEKKIPKAFINFSDTNGLLADYNYFDGFFISINYNSNNLQVNNYYLKGDSITSNQYYAVNKIKNNFISKPACYPHKFILDNEIIDININEDENYSNYLDNANLNCSDQDLNNKSFIYIIKNVSNGNDDESINEDEGDINEDTGDDLNEEP